MSAKDFINSIPWPWLRNQLGGDTVDPKFIDRRTGLENKGAYDAFISKIKDKIEIPITIVYCDVNGLKMANRKFGDEEVSRLVLTATDLIKHTLSSSSKIFKIGTDEFCVIYEGVNLNQVRNETQLLEDACAERSKVFRFPLSISVGISYCSPGEDIDAAIKCAEEDMYAQKSKFYSMFGNG